MNEIKKEDWNCVFNIEDPDFEKKFNELIKKYIAKKELEFSKMENKKEGKDMQSRLNSFKYFFEYENWLTILPTRTKIALTKKDKKKIFVEKAFIFKNFLVLLRNV